MLYFKEFWRTEQDVSGKSNSHWNPREVERRIDKEKAAVLWPAGLPEVPMQQPVGQGPVLEAVNAGREPEVKSGEPKASWRARASWWLSLLAFGSLPLLWVYIFYSDVTQTGPMGYLFAFEVNTLGFADTAMNMALGLVAALVPCGLVDMAAHKLAQNAPDPAASPVTHKSRRLRILPAFLALVVFGLTALFLHDGNLKLYTIDLSAAVSNTPRDAGFVELKAIH